MRAPGVLIKPLFGRVLMVREKLGKVGSIIIPENAAKRNAPLRGVVVAIGEGCDRSIKVGHTYLMGQFAGTWMNAEGAVIPDGNTAEYFMVQDEDLLAEVVSDE